MAEGNRPLIHVEFINLPVEDPKASREQGRPIFNDVEHCRVRWVGDNKRELVEPAHQKFKFDKDQRRYVTYAEHFHEHYRLFKAGRDQGSTSGTPLSELPFLTEAKRAELRALNIHTAESLAALDGTPLQRLGMGGRDLKNQASAWIDKAASAAVTSRASAENEELRRQIEEMKAQIAALTPGALAVPADISGSPFTNWSDDDIRLWLEENGGEKPHHRTGHDRLVEMADRRNAELARMKEAA